MKDWLMANVFLLGMPFVAAGVFFGSVRLLDAAGMRSDVAVGFLAIGSVIAVFVIFKSVLARIQRH